MFPLSNADGISSSMPEDHDLPSCLSRRSFLRVAVLSAASSLIAPALFPASASGDALSDKSAELSAAREKLEALDAEMGRLAEEMNGALEVQKTAEENMAALSQSIESHRLELADRCVYTYKNKELDYPSVLAGCTSIPALVAALNILDKENEEQSREMETLNAERQQYAEASATAQAQAEEASLKKSEIEASRSEYEAIVATLSAEYQDMLFADMRNRSGVLSHTSWELPEGSLDGTGPNAKVMEWAVRQVGKNYVWGAEGPNTFDCSGLVKWCYAKIGISLPHYTESQFSCAARRISPGDAQPGDVLYKPGHVGLSLGGTLAVEAMSYSQGVCVSNRKVWTHALQF